MLSFQSLLPWILSIPLNLGRDDDGQKYTFYLDPVFWVKLHYRR
jgi:hypothetical protein